MKRVGWSAARWVPAALVLGTLSSAWAADAAPSYMDGSLRKLGRGAANILTCPLELIRTPTLVGREDGTLAGLTVGLIQGIGKTVVRGVAGVVEAATFSVPIPRNFAPLVSPEFVWAHGNWSE